MSFLKYMYIYVAFLSAFLSRAKKTAYKEVGVLVRAVNWDQFDYV